MAHRVVCSKRIVIIERGASVTERLRFLAEVASWTWRTSVVDMRLMEQD
jgi:hypothetical protein